MPLIIPGGAQPGLTIVDNFNRTDASTLGADYTVVGGNSPVLKSNRAQAGDPAWGTNVTYIARHNTQLLGDVQEITFVPIAATAGFSASLGGGMFLRGTTGGDFVNVSVDANKAYINTYLSGTFANRATSAAGSSPTLVRLTAAGSLYSVYINGGSTPAITWNDSGGLIGIGAANRSFGVVCSGSNSFGTSSRGYGIDEYTARDAA